MLFLELPLVARTKVVNGYAEATFDLQGRSFDFEPGQFVRITLHKLDALDPRGASRAMEIVSPSHSETISVRFHVGNPPSGFKKTLLALPLGTLVAVSGPHGGDDSALAMPGESLQMTAVFFEGLLAVLDKAAIVSAMNSEGTIVFVNDKFVEVSGYSRSELVGQNYRMLQSGEHPTEFYRDLWNSVRDGHIWRGEIKDRFKDGSVQWLDTTIAPIMNAQGIPEGYLAIRFLVTDKKHAEAELEHYRRNLEALVEERTSELAAAHEQLQVYAKKLLDADHRKDEFIAVLSHELRNPFAAVMSSLELVDLQGADHPSTPSVIQTARTHLTSMSRLLDDLLDVSRLAHKKFQIRPETVNVCDVIRRSVESLAPFAQGKGQTLRMSLPGGAVWMQADPLRLEQIFGNILSNAIKYTPAGGSIEVRATEGRRSISVHITDSGAGIPADMHESIFEMFVRAKSAPGAGLGIGLSLTKRLVDLHKGTIEVRSKEGVGSEFVVRLPTHEVAQHPLHFPVEAKKVAGALNILVVDDNEAVARGMGKLLSCRGHHVGIAHTWRDALAQAHEGYDVALLDIGMPEMDGYELARRIRQEVSDPPVLIALTGYGQEEDKRKAYESGYAYHLTKPVGLADIEAVLAKIVVAPR